MTALTAPVAGRIRDLHAVGLDLEAIAIETGVRVRTVNEVVRGRREGRPLNAREQVEEDERTGWAPLCLDTDEWDLWRRTNPTGWGRIDFVARPCGDCPLGFAADMRAGGRCNGTPGWTPPDTDTDEEPAVTPAEETPVAEPTYTLPETDGARTTQLARATIMREAVDRHGGDRAAAAAELGISTQVLGVTLVKTGMAEPRQKAPKNAPCAKAVDVSVPVPPELVHTVVTTVEAPRHAPELVAGVYEPEPEPLHAPGPSTVPPLSHERMLDALRAAAQSAAALEDDLASAAMWAPRLKSLRRLARRLRRDIAVAWVDRQ